jgi:hypothetical protein
MFEWPALGDGLVLALILMAVFAAPRLRGWGDALGERLRWK